MFSEVKDRTDLDSFFEIGLVSLAGHIVNCSPKTQEPSRIGTWDSPESLNSRSECKDKIDWASGVLQK